MGEPATAVSSATAVLDNGTGVYLWHGRERHHVPDDWVFMARFRCDHCGRDVTIMRFDRTQVDERRLLRLKGCPGGCDSIQQWLAT